MMIGEFHIWPGDYERNEEQRMTRRTLAPKPSAIFLRSIVNHPLLTKTK